MNNERTRHGTVDKSSSEQQICVSASIFCIVEKNWAHAPTASGSYGRMADRRNAGGFQKF